MTEPTERTGRSPQAPKVMITLAGPAAGPDARRVEAPDRVLRLWAMLNATDAELHAGASAETLESVARLRQSLLAARAELEQSVSAPLAVELGRLLHPQLASPGPDELRIECASLLGWIGGLVVEMLCRLDATADIARSAPPTRSLPSSFRPMAADDRLAGQARSGGLIYEAPAMRPNGPSPLLVPLGVA